MLALLALLALLACGDKAPSGDSAPTDSEPAVIDEDGDGYRQDADCDDTNPDVNPGAGELCNGVDDNCNDVIDENALDAADWFPDLDGDGFGGLSDKVTSCDAPSGYVEGGDDCDDSDDSVHPDADEVCDGIDNDCDGGADDVDPDGVSGTSTWYEDADEDGYGTDENTTEACDVPSGYADNADDCDDTSSEWNPDAEESCADPNDYNCDGSVGYADEDGDGVAACEDCDDTEAARFDGNPEICDGLDNDCDGVVPDEELDLDADGYTECVWDGDWAGDSSVVGDEDCDDDDDSAWPGADELCDGVDNDCEGDVDEDDAIDATTWYADSDSDGYGDASTSDVECEQPSGYVADDTDCDDADGDEHPGAAEVCDGVDEDCDGEVDEDVTYIDYYLDSDGDGYGDSTGGTQNDCIEPSGYSTTDDDCDDSDADVNPGADEYCDDVDNDCDGDTDEDSALDASTWYADTDADGYGDSSSTTAACEVPSGYTSDTTDCDDTDGDIHPTADEHCDDVDEDCDGSVDEDAVDPATWYIDSDGDGDGEASSTAEACDEPSGYVATDTDCDDSDSTVYDGATELCDGLDNDCDGSLWSEEEDDDSDGYVECTIDSGGWDATSSKFGDDCDDTTASVSPGSLEYCDSVDNDCDGATDESAVDATTYYADDDSDGYGDASDSTDSCSSVTGYVTDDTDCDDGDGDVNPGETETANCVDDDCDGSTDESVSYTYTHDSDIQSIWSSACSSCHTTGSSGGLSLTSAYSKIVNVASSDIATMDLVDDSCDTDDSYIWHKLQGTHSSVGGAGSTMPKGSTLSSSDEAMIKTWIEEGAPN
ncbi:MAG: hypothetical protein GY913_14575 [Proteobacteria bacterium]|nr:hypothetical protein [Pseudomonadota bacterium]